ncbi:hypothetical protein BH09PSE4_BH09PSE4_07540 [soil metagenome]
MTRLLFLLAAMLLVGATTPIQPGKWQTTVTIVDVQGGMPGMAAMMKGRPTVVSACVSPVDAARGPRAAIEKTNGACHYISYAVSGGRISSVMQCVRPGGTMTVRSSGSYSPAMIDVHGVATMTGGMAMTLKTHTISKRIGGC